MRPFSIRPRRVEGESLSSYFMRICFANVVHPSNVLRFLSRDGLSLSFGKDSFRIDVFPEQYLDVERLAVLCGLTKDEVHKMCLSPLRAKFYDEADDVSKAINMMSRSIEKQKRYFCRDCLKERPAYMLMWQIKGITMCPIHRVKLECKCTSCGREQPYSGELLPERKCSFCRSPLLGAGEPVDDDETLHEQLRCWHDWRYILCEDEPLVRKIGDYSYEKSFHLLLLALHQQMPEVVFKGWKWSGFVNFLLEKPDSHRCSIHQLLQATREYGIPIQFVSEIELIPQSLQAILDAPTGLETAKRTPKRPPTSSPANYGPPNFGPCLAPWCESYRKNDAMVLTPKKAGWHLCAACTSCSMQYGRKRATSEWCARTKDILFMWEKIFPLLQEGRTNAEIGRLLGTDKRTILRAQAYFAYHKIGSLKSHKMFDEIVTPTNIVECFEKLVVEDTDELKMQRRASKTFGWSQRCFYYFLAHAEVQAMLRNHQRSPSKEPGMRHEVKTITGTQDVFVKMVEQELYRMMKDGDTITQKTVAARLGCGVQTLRRHGLAKSISEAGKYQAELAAASETMSVRHQINRLLAVGEMQRSVVTLKLIEQSMQMSMNTLRHSSPTLFQWIQTELRKHRERVRVLVVDDYKELIKTIVEDVRMEHGRVLVTKVVERLDVNYITLLRTFPEVIEFIKEFGRQA